MDKEYQPRKGQADILDRAEEHIRSVPYRVTARWLFYRLLQDGIYHGKGDYHSQFLPLTAKARKRFYGNWRPDTLADDTRELIPGGDGFDDPGEWLEALKDQLEFPKSKWLNQDYYVEIWFEAAAMASQFRYYTEELPLFAFHGDVSIPGKWDTAKRLESSSKRYGLPVVVIYFGDDDEKGWLIPKSALADIRDWCRVDFEFIRGGLNDGDGLRLGIPENPEKPGTYQWEALSDNQAGDIITGLVDSYYDKEALADIRDEESEVTKKFREKFKDFIANWERLGGEDGQISMR
ncbi:hypothetical protein ES703_42657 [subsurface metagenome]